MSYPKREGELSGGDCPGGNCPTPGLGNMTIDERSPETGIQTELSVCQLEVRLPPNDR